MGVRAIHPCPLVIRTGPRGTRWLSGLVTCEACFVPTTGAARVPEVLVAEPLGVRGGLRGGGRLVLVSSERREQAVELEAGTAFQVRE
jgi:hypothetical protein